MKEYKLVAPDIDRLLLFFDRGHINPSIPSKALVTAMEPLFSTLSDLAPMENKQDLMVLEKGKQKVMSPEIKMKQKDRDLVVEWFEKAANTLKKRA